MNSFLGAIFRREWSGTEGKKSKLGTLNEAYVEHLHIFVSVSDPKINSVLIALYDFQRIADLGRPISKA